MMLTSLYKISSPPKETVDIRDAKVKALIKQMGDKYLLAKPMQRIQDDKRH